MFQYYFLVKDTFKSNTGLNTWPASCLMHTVHRNSGLLERELWTRPGEKTGESSSFIIAQSHLP